MTANIHEPTPQRAITANRFTAKDTRQKPLASKWIEPVDVASSDLDPEWTPILQNGYEQVVDPLQQFAFRLHYDGSLEFRGHLDVSGASSGDIALTLPGGDGTTPDYLVLPNDQYWTTAITDDGGTNFIFALVLIEADSGDVTLFWPAQ